MTKQPGSTSDASAKLNQLRACRMTPVGRGALATIALRGDLERLHGLLRCANGKLPENQPINRICFSHWGADSPEECVFVRTGPGQAEIHCHGGLAAAARILHEITAAGGEAVSPADWVREERSPVETQCLEALLHAQTRRTARHLLRQSTLFPASLRQLRTMTPNQQQQSIAQMLEWSRFGTHLATPWKVVLCGEPNVGKSSLLNALLGYGRSIVFDQPGTTRDVVSAATALNGWPILLIDTAGLRRVDEELEAEAIRRARREVTSADVAIIVRDVTHSENAEEISFDPGIETLFIWNKIDLAPPPRGDGALPVSARTNVGLDRLIDQLVKRLVPKEPSPDVPFPVSVEQSNLLRRLLDLSIAGDCAAFDKHLVEWIDPV